MGVDALSELRCKIGTIDSCKHLLGRRERDGSKKGDSGKREEDCEREGARRRQKRREGRAPPRVPGVRARAEQRLSQ